MYWNFIKDIIGSKGPDLYPQYFRINNQTINDPKVIANNFNDFFINIGPQLADKIPESSITYQHYLNMPNKDSTYIDPTVPEEVTKLSNALKDSASGHDGFNRTIISVIFQTILGPLVHIINLSLFSGVVPKEIKIAKVKPLFKADNQHLIIIDPFLYYLSCLNCLKKYYNGGIHGKA